MTRVLLVRHGAVDIDGIAYGQRVDPDLSVRGREQVAALRRRLHATGPEHLRLGDQPPRVVVRTPTARTAATCALLGWAHEHLDARFSERDLGSWEGQAWSQLWPQAPAGVTTDPARFAAFTPPGGETLEDLQLRVVTALEELGRDHAVDDPGAVPPVAVVCHGGPILCALAHVLGLEPAAVLRMRVATASATWLTRWPDGNWTVEGVAT